MILRTKLHIPHSRRNVLVERRAIAEMLNEGQRIKLTAVTAPGGYGKTTALSQWVLQSGISPVWVSLDPQDNDLAQFWSYVIAAVDSKHPSFAEAVSPYVSALKSGAFEPFIAAVIHELGSCSNELTLIFDDYHAISLASIHASLAFLLERLPAHIHLYIASRAELPFPTARLQSTGQMVFITIHDLRFQLDEGIRYFHDCMGISLTEGDIDQLVRRTEGWISGLHLAAISLKRNDNVPDFIRAFSGEHRSISDYLFQEVFNHQSKEIQSFLLETSILSTMNGALCESVTGQPHCQELLEILEQQNLFIIPLDDQRQWYRYHHLFSEFLRKQFRHKYGARSKTLYIKAACWLEEHGFLEEAVEHLLMDGLHHEAVSFIEKHLHDLDVKSGVLYRWFRTLPQSCFEGKPGIQFLYVKVMVEANEMKLAEERLRMMEDKLSDPEWTKFVGTILYLSAYISFYRKDFRRTTEYLERFDRHMPEGSYIQMIDANTFTINYDSMLAFFNDLHEAEDFLFKWIKVWENRDNYPYVGFFYVAYSSLLYEWNRLDEAEVYAERALRQKCMQPYALILVRAALSYAQICQSQGDSAKAFDLLEQVRLKIDSPDKPIFVKMLDAEKAFLSLANDCLDDVAAWLQTCGLKHADTIPLSHVREYLHLARALTECGQVNEALQLLEQLYRLVDDTDRRRDKIKVSILQSMALHRKGDATNAVMKLEAALQLAEPGEYIRSFIDEGAGMAQLLSRYLHLRQHQSARMSESVSLTYVKKLLFLMKDHLEETAASGSLLTMQELRIIRLIEDGLSNKQIAEQIHVTAETVKSHLKNIYRKLDVNNRWQALQRGKELKLL